MSTVEKLLIKGIRSFSPDNTTVIEFYKPLTLIVGANGAGKTTIIECLKQACTGELPPNTRSGQSFIHDPKVSNETETKAQIKLRFKNSCGMPVVVLRSFQVHPLRSLEAGRHATASTNLLGIHAPAATMAAASAAPSPGIHVTVKTPGKCLHLIGVPPTETGGALKARVEKLLGTALPESWLEFERANKVVRLDLPLSIYECERITVLLKCGGLGGSSEILRLRKLFEASMSMEEVQLFSDTHLHALVENGLITGAQLVRATLAMLQAYVELPDGSRWLLGHFLAFQHAFAAGAADPAMADQLRILLDKQATGIFFDSALYELVQKSVVVIDYGYTNDPGYQDAPLTRQNLERLQAALAGPTAVAATVDKVFFYCTGAFIAEEGMIVTTAHGLAKNGKATVGMRVRVWAPAFGPAGVLDCEVEKVDESLDFARLRVTDVLKPGGAGSCYLPVCSAAELPKLTQRVALVSGGVYAAKQEGVMPSISMTTGSVTRFSGVEVQCDVTSWRGDSGAAIVMSDGKMLSMHTNAFKNSEDNVPKKAKHSINSNHSYARASTSLLAFHMLPWPQS